MRVCGGRRVALCAWRCDAGGCQLSRLSSDWPCGTFQFQWAAVLWAALRTRPCRLPIYNAGGGLFETTFMRSLMEVTKSGEYSRKRGGQILMKKGQQGQVGLSYRLRERLLTTRHGDNG